MALTTNLVAYYKLDESSGDAADSSGGGFTLTNVGTCGFAAGLINNAADGGSANTTKRFEIANNLGITGGDITISAWINITTAPASGALQRIFQQNDSTNDIEYYAIYKNNGGTLQLFFERALNGVADNSFTSNQDLGTGTWKHIVLTYDGTQVEGFLNATSLGTVASVGVGVGDTDNFAIMGAVGGTQNLKGLEDEVGVWSRELTGAEITSLYNAGAGLAYPFTGTSAHFLTLTGVGT